MQLRAGAKGHRTHREPGSSVVRAALMLAYIASKAGRTVMPPESQNLLQTCEEEVAPIIRRVVRRAAIARRHIVAAADQCSLTYLRKFLAEGVCPNDHIHGWTPLLKLCGQTGYREREDVEEVLACVDAVLEAGADANLVSQFGEFQSRSISPLELAAGLKLPWDLGPCPGIHQQNTTPGRA